MNFISRPIFKGKYAGKEFLIRVSARTRGEEIAEYLGANYNKFGDGPTIWIKPRNLKQVKDNDYLDIIDGVDLIEQIKQRPKIRVITMSLVEHEYLKTILPNELILIHHPHINFENLPKKKNKKLIGGIIGKPSGYAYNIYNKIKDKIGNFTHCYDFKTREDMVEYYRGIDYLVIWFPEWEDRNQWHRHPTKIINAASFGIPTFAQPIAGYREMEGLYFPIETIADIDLDKITDKFCEKIKKEAEKYHISKIAELYKKL